VEKMMGNLLTAGGQILILILLAPLVNGIIKKVKALTQCRRGPGIFQPYFDVLKFLKREPVVSEHTSWITLFTPYVCLGAYLTAGCLIPLWEHHNPGFGDLIALTYLFALSRFFLALAGLEPASAFGGMGSSREMMIASLVEPVMVLGLFGLVVAAGTTDLKGLTGTGQNPAGLLAFIGLMVVTVAETGRIPVDNPDTHLELTMVHEAMLLEYSSRQKAAPPAIISGSLNNLILANTLSISASNSPRAITLPTNSPRARRTGLPGCWGQNK